MSIEFPFEPQIPPDTTLGYVPGTFGSGYDGTEIHEPVQLPVDSKSDLIGIVPYEGYADTEPEATTETSEPTETSTNAAPSETVDQTGEHDEPPSMPHEVAQTQTEPELRSDQPEEKTTHVEETTAEAENPEETSAEDEGIEVIAEPPVYDPNDIEDAVVVETSDAKASEQPSVVEKTGADEAAPAAPEMPQEESEGAQVARVTQLAEEVNSSDLPFTAEVEDDNTLLVTFKGPTESPEALDLPGPNVNTELGVMKDGTWLPGKDREQPVEERRTLIPDASSDQAASSYDTPAYTGSSGGSGEYDDPPEVDPDESTDAEEYEPSEAPEVDEPDEAPEVDEAQATDEVSDTPETPEKSPETLDGAPETAQPEVAKETQEHAQEVADDPRLMEAARQLLHAMLPGKPDPETTKAVLGGLSRMLFGLLLAPVLIPGTRVTSVEPVQGRKFTYRVGMTHTATLNSTHQVIYAPNDRAAKTIARMRVLHNGQMLG